MRRRRVGVEKEEAVGPRAGKGGGGGSWEEGLRAGAGKGVLGLGRGLVGARAGKEWGCGWELGRGL